MVWREGFTPRSLRYNERIFRTYVQKSFSRCLCCAPQNQRFSENFQGFVFRKMLIERESYVRLGLLPSSVAPVHSFGKSRVLCIK